MNRNFLWRLGGTLFSAVIIGVALNMLVPPVSWRAVVGLMMAGTLLSMALEAITGNTPAKRAMQTFVAPVIVWITMLAMMRLMALCLLGMRLDAVEPILTGVGEADFLRMVLEPLFAMVAGILAFKGRIQYHQKTTGEGEQATSTWELGPEGRWYRRGFFFALATTFVLVLVQVNSPKTIATAGKIVRAHTDKVMQQGINWAQSVKADVQPTWGIVKPGIKAKLYHRLDDGNLSVSKQYLDSGTIVLEVLDESPGDTNNLSVRKIRLRGQHDDYMTKNPKLEAWVQEDDFSWSSEKPTAP